MKKYIWLLTLALIFVLTACAKTASLQLVVTNQAPVDRVNEMVELPMSEILEKLRLTNPDQLVVLDNDRQQIPYQHTSNDLLIFQVSIKANGTANYTIESGKKEEFPTYAYGRHYPERLDDIAWENEFVAYRTYGPALQASGERAYGYDIWLKNVPEMVVEERYKKELDPETLAQIASLKKTDPKAARELRNATSYHVDHGNGNDCYKVGPTLGGGATAFYVNDSIIYPYCYRTFEILDNGPLRFRCRLTYNPLTVAGDSNVIETRIITLDAGSYLNKTVVSYENLSEPQPFVVGIVLHEPSGELVADKERNYISYVDPTDNVNNNNGQIFVGAAFEKPAIEIKPVYLSEAEKKARDAQGHLLAITNYKPDEIYTYYWGGAWSKANIKDAASWDNYMTQFVQRIKQPLTLTVR